MTDDDEKKQQPRLQRLDSLMEVLKEHSGEFQEAPPPTPSGGTPSGPRPHLATGIAAHTFKVVGALSSNELFSVELPLAPPPTLNDLKAELLASSILGKLLVDNKAVEDGHVFNGLQEGGTTVVQLVKGNFINIKEAGLYNGIYEQHGENDGRPAFKMVKPDNEKSGERWVYYSSGRVLPGWKFNDRFAPEVGEWDMLAPSGSGDGVTDDIPEGKYRLDNGGTGVKANAPRISKLTRAFTKDEVEANKKAAAIEEQQNIATTECGGCVNGDAQILMSDGTSKEARFVEVGDALMVGGSPGVTTKVEARIIEVQATQQLVKLDKLLITPHHPVVYDGQWVFPQAVPGSCLVDADIELYNFITTNREAILVNGMVATSVGTYCEGLHDVEQNSEHRIWGTDAIVQIYKQHPQWPNITSNTQETVAAVEAAKDGARGQLWSVQNCSALRKGQGSDTVIASEAGNA